MAEEPFSRWGSGGLVMPLAVPGDGSCSPAVRSELAHLPVFSGLHFSSFENKKANIHSSGLEQTEQYTKGIGLWQHHLPAACSKS